MRPTLLLQLEVQLFICAFGLVPNMSPAAWLLELERTLARLPLGLSELLLLPSFM